MNSAVDHFPNFMGLRKYIDRFKYFMDQFLDLMDCCPIFWIIFNILEIVFTFFMGR